MLQSSIIIGLSLFIAGNILAAISESVYFLIFARFIQGTGAISSTVFALIADLTRPEVRTRANAVIGISIGIAFASAFAFALCCFDLPCFALLCPAWVCLALSALLCPAFLRFAQLCFAWVS